MNKYLGYKLKIDAKPSLFHGKTVRKAIGQSLWYRIRDHILKKDTPVCNICGFSPQQDEMRKLHLHEIEHYDFENIVVKLVGLNLICEDCHAFHHFGLTQKYASKEKMSNLVNHFMAVNECTLEDFNSYKKILTFRRDPVDEKVLKRCKLSFQDIATGNYDVKYMIGDSVPFKNLIIERLKKKDVFFDK